MRMNVILISLLLGSLPASAATLNNLYFGLDRGAEIYWWFLADGRVMMGLPTTGISPQEFEGACQPAPNNCGNYTLSGDKLTIKYRNGKSEVWPIQVQSDGIMLNYSIPMTPVGKYPAGTRLNGTWDRPFTSQFATSGMSVAAVTSPTFLTFKSDGTYGEKQMTGLSTGSIVNGASVTRSQTVQLTGTYTIKDNVLMLVKSGKSERHFIFPAVGDRLNIDGHLYSKEK
jgi:hypothetical protein